MPRFGHPIDFSNCDADVLSTLRAFALTQQFALTGPLTTQTVGHSDISRAEIVRAIACAVTDSTGNPPLHTWCRDRVIAWSSLSPAASTSAYGVVYIAPATPLDTVISLHRIGHSITPEADQGSLQQSHTHLPPQITPDFVSAFSLVCRRVHQAILSMHASQLLPHTLSDAHLNVLSLTARGLNPLQLASELGCEVQKVHTHIREAVSTLSCTTKAQAVLRAASLGLISLPH